MIDFNFRGEEYHLYFNGSVLFDAYARFGSDKNILDVIEPMDKAGFEATVWLLCELATQGELYRRFLGYTPRPRLVYAKTLVQIQPKELPEIKQAVIAALNEGFAREAEESYDPWLAELESQKKKTKRHKSGVYPPSYAGPWIICAGGHDAAARADPGHAGDGQEKGGRRWLHGRFRRR